MASCFICSSGLGTLALSFCKLASMARPRLRLRRALRVGWAWKLGSELPWCSPFALGLGRAQPADGQCQDDGGLSERNALWHLEYDFCAWLQHQKGEGCCRHLQPKMKAVAKVTIRLKPLCAWKYRPALREHSNARLMILSTNTLSALTNPACQRDRPGEPAR